MGSFRSGNAPSENTAKRTQRLEGVRGDKLLPRPAMAPDRKPPVNGEMLIVCFVKFSTLVPQWDN
jgi:hypothetical protein